MLRNTFCHMPGIGPKSERALWEAGLTGWEALTPNAAAHLPPRRRERLCAYAGESATHLAAGNGGYFAERMPSRECWRLFPEFRQRVAYLDIETTGLDGMYDTITTIALYDGQSVFTFVNGRNLDAFAACIARYQLVVTFNGKTFDIPFIRNALGVVMPHAHIDLRYVLADLGYRGGLKSCERQLGLDRGELADIDGYAAVLLWQDYRRNGNGKALETLLAYNIADVVNLATIMPVAYNRKLADTPFLHSHTLPITPPQWSSPYQADPATLRRIRRHLYS